MQYRRFDAHSERTIVTALPEKTQQKGQDCFYP
jgi:hypothetical protein